MTTEAAQGTSYDKLVEYQGEVAGHHPQRSQRRSARLDDWRQRGGDAGRTEPGPDRRPPRSRAATAKELANRHHREAAAAAGGGRRHRRLHAEPADGPDRRAGEQEPLSVFDAVARPRGALRGVARAEEGARGASDGLEDLTSDLEVTSPQVDVEIDRDKAAALGVTANQIENAFYDAYGPRWVSTIYAPVNEYKVLLELAAAVPGRSGGAVAALLQGDTDRRDRRRTVRRQAAGERAATWQGRRTSWHGERRASWCRSTRWRATRRSSVRRP